MPRLLGQLFFYGSTFQILATEQDNPGDVALTEMAFRRGKFTNKLVVVGDGQEALDFHFCRDKYAGRDPNEKPSVILLDH